ncbi:MAG: protein jag [Selenomonadaceae bacterium]|nr:protein jag [Selenomonadaceae bacterium]
MATIIEKSGKTVEDALQAALDELKANTEDVEMEVLESPSKGIFGIFGAKPAKIRVTLKEKNFSEVVEEKIPEVTEEKIPEVIEGKIPEVIEEKIPEVENNFDRKEVIDRAKKFLSEVFSAMKIEVEINSAEDENDVLLDLTGKNLGLLIGKHGQTLDSLQYLTNLTANKFDSTERLHFILDVENYRQRRAETLHKLAKSVAEKAIRTRQPVKLEPMNRHERRVIHTALQNNKRVETHSTGEEPYRYVIVSPKKRGR